MIVLDTNVISELTKPQRDPNVVSWAKEQSDDALWITSTTVSELELGLSLMPEGRRDAERDRKQVEIIVDFHDRIIPFDTDPATIYGDVVNARRVIGRPISRADAQIAASCLSREAILATRNTKDFEGIPLLEVVNPWDKR